MMAAEFYDPVFRAPNAERADGYFRLWGSYLGGMPARERERQERAGVIGPRRMVAVGTMAAPDSAAFRGALVAVHDDESVHIL